jgi:phosphonate transport system substrate-binding protein
MKHTTIRWISVIIASLWLLNPIRAAERYNLGIFPYYDPATLVSLHKPLKDFLEAELGISISMRSASNFRSFKSRAAEGIYDILITAPHLGRTAETVSGYQWIGFTLNRSHAVFVVKKDSGISSLSDLKGKAITLPPKAAIIHHVALKHLRNNGLEPNVDIKIIETNSHDNAMKSVENSSSPVAAFGKPTWDRYVLDSGKDLIKIDHSEDIPGFAILANSRINGKMVQAIREAIVRFTETDTGKDYFNKSGLKGFRLAENVDFEQLDSYLAEIKANKE